MKFIVLFSVLFFVSVIFAHPGCNHEHGHDHDHNEVAGDDQFKNFIQMLENASKEGNEEAFNQLMQQFMQEHGGDLSGQAEADEELEKGDVDAASEGEEL